MSEILVGLRVTIDGDQQVTLGLEDVAQASEQVEASTQGAARGADRMKKSTERATRGLGAWIRKLKAAHPVAAKLGQYLLGAAGVTGGVYAIQAAARAIVTAGLSIERYRAKLLAATGSHAQAAREIGFVRAEAERLGLDFDVLAQSYGNFAVAVRGTALEGREARDIFTAVAEASRAMYLSGVLIPASLGHGFRLQCDPRRESELHQSPPHRNNPLPSGERENGK